MNLRDLKLAIACGTESDEIKALNKFFDDLFSSLTIFTKGDDEADLIFMKSDKCFMELDLKNEILWCRNDTYWQILEEKYHCTYAEIQGIIQYKVEEYFKIVPFEPHTIDSWYTITVENVFKNCILTPYKN